MRLSLSIEKLEYFFTVDILQASVLHCHGPSHGGRAFVNLLRGPRKFCVGLRPQSPLEEHGVHCPDLGLTGGLSYLALSNGR